MNSLRRLAMAALDIAHSALAHPQDPLPSFTADQLMARYDDVVRTSAAKQDLINRLERELTAARQAIGTHAAQETSWQKERAEFVSKFRDLAKLAKAVVSFDESELSKNATDEEEALYNWLTENAS